MHKDKYNFCLGGDNYITNKVRVVTLARDTPTDPPLHQQTPSSAELAQRMLTVKPSKESTVYGILILSSLQTNTDTFANTLKPLETQLVYLLFLFWFISVYEAFVLHESTWLLYKKLFTFSTVLELEILLKFSCDGIHYVPNNKKYAIKKNTKTNKQIFLIRIRLEAISKQSVFYRFWKSSRMSVKIKRHFWGNLNRKIWLNGSLFIGFCL